MAGLLVGGAVVSLASSNCGSPTVPSIAPVDAAASETPPTPDAEPALDPDACVPPVGPVSDWPGWSRLTQLDPCCTADVALDPATVLPAYAWIPCLNGAPNCTEFKADWRANPGPFGGAQVSRIGSVPKLLLLGRVMSPDGNLFEEDVFDFASGAPLAGFRSDFSQRRCSLSPIVGGGGVTLYGWLIEGGEFVAHDTPQAIASPVFQHLVIPGFIGAQEMATSDTTFAFDMEPEGQVYRTKLGSGVVTHANSTGHPALLLDFVEGDDVFAESEHGSAGWSEEYRVDASGAVTLFRANPMAHVACVRTDGTTIFWTETYGSTNLNGPQQHTEIWAAPYTSDGAQLAGTGKKIADVASTWLPIDAVASGGVYAFYSFAEDAIVVVRLADGNVVHVAAPGNYTYGPLVYVSATEVWSLMGQKAGPTGVAFARVAIGW